MLAGMGLTNMLAGVLLTNMLKGMIAFRVGPDDPYIYNHKYVTDKYVID